MCFSPNFTQGCFSPNFSSCFGTEWIPERIASGIYSERAVGLLEVPGWHLISVYGAGRLQLTYQCRTGAVWTVGWEECERCSQPFLDYREISTLFSNIHPFFFSSLDLFIRRTNQLLHQMLDRRWQMLFSLSNRTLWDSCVFMSHFIMMHIHFTSGKF